MNRKLMILVMSFVLLFTSMPAAVFAETANSTAETASAKPSLSVTKGYFYVGGKMTLKLNNAGSQKVKWKSKNKKIAKVNSKGKVTAKKTGTTYVTATCGGRKYKCKIIVLSDSKFLKKFCKEWVRTYITSEMTDYEKVLMAEYYVSQAFRYGSTGGSASAMDVLKKGKGTCYSGNKLLVALLKSMGFKAKLRFAAKDKMSRYPEGIIFFSQHYNVQVTIKGKKYYVDGTPESKALYMSSSKKPVFFMHCLFGDWMTVTDELPKK